MRYNYPGPSQGKLNTLDELNNRLKTFYQPFSMSGDIVSLTHLRVKENLDKFKSLGFLSNEKDRLHAVEWDENIYKEICNLSKDLPVIPVNESYLKYIYKIPNQVIGIDFDSMGQLTQKTFYEIQRALINTNKADVFWFRYTRTARDHNGLAFREQMELELKAFMATYFMLLDYEKIVYKNNKSTMITYQWICRNDNQIPEYV